MEASATFDFDAYVAWPKAQNSVKGFYHLPCHSRLLSTSLPFSVPLPPHLYIHTPTYSPLQSINQITNNIKLQTANNSITSLILVHNMDIKTVHRDEEGKHIDKITVPSRSPHPETVRVIEKKLFNKGLHRLDRHPVDGLGGIGAPPRKSGRGGKYTWEGPDGVIESELDPAPAALDPKDPNYIPPEENTEEVEDVVVGEVEVAKAPEAKEGVARIEVVPAPKAEKEEEEEGGR